MMSKYQIACYYFPNYHQDPRNAARYGVGWNEWNLVRQAAPRFEGHQQPKVPLWGYEDEADPAAMAKKIDAAADHALDTFIFDWYAYDDGLFLNRALDEGFLGAANNKRLKFALMWANHDWIELFPARLDQSSALHYSGAVSLQAFERITDDIIARYFSHASYWLIDGCPYFSIYETYRLIMGLGGFAQAREALQGFRRKVQAAGFRDLHLNAVVWGLQLLPGTTVVSNPAEMVHALGFDSVTSYAWVHHTPFATFPATDYGDVMADAAQQWGKLSAQFDVPYYPNVSMGWDPTPRCAGNWHEGGYPFTPVLVNNTPHNFKLALQHVKAFLDGRPSAPKIANINAWNEWTEGSYLEPDTVNGYGYLEAIRDVFAAK